MLIKSDSKKIESIKLYKAINKWQYRSLPIVVLVYAAAIAFIVALLMAGDEQIDIGVDSVTKPDTLDTSDKEEMQMQMKAADSARNDVKLTDNGSDSENIKEKDGDTDDTGTENEEQEALIALALVLAVAVHILTWLGRNWSVSYQCWDCFSGADSLSSATHALITPLKKEGFKTLVTIDNYTDADTYTNTKEEDKDKHVRYSFVFQKTTYVYADADADGDAVFKKTRYPSRRPVSDYYKAKLTDLDVNVNVRVRSEDFGSNEMRIPVPSFIEVFKEHAVAPFFVFQIFSVGLWVLENMWQFSLLTLFLLVMMEAITVKSRIKNMAELRGIGVAHEDVNVYRDGKWRLIPSDKLVPWDLVAFGRSRARSHDRERDDANANGFVAPCDVVILSGSALVNEAALTGESIPQTKSPLYERERDTTMSNDNSLVLKRDKKHVIFAGTSIVQHSTSTSDGGSELVMGESIPSAPGGMCLCRVVRTGFGTAQGKLVRTILFATERPTAASSEAGFFLLFLLVFALVAAFYVVKHGLESGRVKWKIVLHFFQILTSVVPPELPVELSLAVNNSVIALKKLGVHCTEPFKIPPAGMIDIACFDKTGTLTADNLELKGVVVLNSDNDSNTDNIPEFMTSPTQYSSEMLCGIAGCQELVVVPGVHNRGPQGDPIELAALEGINFSLTKDGQVVSHGLPMKYSIEIVTKYSFSSALRLMSAVYIPRHDGQKAIAVAVAKGAPEAIYKILDPKSRLDYDRYMTVADHYARLGGRVLAIAAKPLTQGLGSREIRAMSREQTECDMSLLGMMVFDCPLRTGAVETVTRLAKSSRVAMITGDHTLTACSVAKSVSVSDPAKDTLVAESILTGADDKPVVEWSSISSTKAHMNIQVAPSASECKKLANDYNLCISGDVFARIEAHGGHENENENEMLLNIIPHISVFSRMSPQQKETAVLAMKDAGYTTLMCGDGTNDVGALSRSNVGVALLSAENVKSSGDKANETEKVKVKVKEMEGSGSSSTGTLQRRISKMKSKSKPKAKAKPKPKAKAKAKAEPVTTMKQKENENDDHHQSVMDDEHNLGDGGVGVGIGGVGKENWLLKQLEKMSKEAEEAEGSMLAIKPGDACVAAPFSSKAGDIRSVLEIVRQGRCTLATTMQMYRILSINCLIAAYSLSIMHLSGIRYDDTQMFFSGILLAVCYYFISTAKPADQLSEKKPPQRLFSAFMLLSMLGQFAINLFSLITAMDMAKQHSSSDSIPDPESEFEPTLLNTCVYLISIIQEVSTFGVNYTGKPHMQSIKQNKGLMYCLAATIGFALILSSQIVIPINETLNLIVFPSGAFTMSFLKLQIGNMMGLWAWQTLLKWIFGQS